MLISLSQIQEAEDQREGSVILDMESHQTDVTLDSQSNQKNDEVNDEMNDEVNDEMNDEANDEVSDNENEVIDEVIDKVNNECQILSKDYGLEKKNVECQMSKDGVKNAVWKNTLHTYILYMFLLSFVRYRRS